MQRPRVRHFAVYASRTANRTEGFGSLIPSALARVGRGVLTGSLFRVIPWLVSAWLIGAANPALAAEPTATTGRSAQSLDEQVQEIKSDVLAIAAELDNLEERLLYPSNTQIAVFVSIERDEPVALDAAHIAIDGQPIAHHIYSFKEVEALQKGGVQRIYTGNVPTGAHELQVTISGKRGGDHEFELVEKFAFSKEVAPKLVGVTLGGGLAGSTTMAIEDW